MNNQIALYTKISYQLQFDLLLDSRIKVKFSLIAQLWNGISNHVYVIAFCLREIFFFLAALRLRAQSPLVLSTAFHRLNGKVPACSLSLLLRPYLPWLIKKTPRIMIIAYQIWSWESICPFNLHIQFSQGHSIPALPACPQASGKQLTEINTSQSQYPPHTSGQVRFHIFLWKVEITLWRECNGRVFFFLI